MIKQQSRYLRELKTPQKVGGDVLGVQSLPTTTTAYVSSLTVGSGNGWLHQVPAVPSNSTLTLWNFLISVFVDATIGSNGIPDMAHLYPIGGSLTSGQVQLKYEVWIDWASSSDILNTRNLFIYLTNNDTSPHVYTTVVKWYFPSLGQTG